jgi:ribosomal protein S18 acetylase RimI-like enzyme
MLLPAIHTYIHTHPHTHTHTHTGKYGYLIWLGVSPKFQRFGVGKKLLRTFQVRVWGVLYMLLMALYLYCIVL